MNYRKLIILLMALVLQMLYITSLISAEEYRKELFLSFPQGHSRGALIYGPSSIGIDFDNNLSLLWGNTLFTYNKQGAMIRELEVKSAHDVCFDEEDNAYLYLNTSGEVHINKYDNNRTLVGRMDNDMTTVQTQSMKETFLGSSIRYIPEYGLLLHGSTWDHIPVDFFNGKVDDFTLSSKIVPGMVVKSGLNLITEYESKEVKNINFISDKPIESIRFKGITYMSVEIIYSLDFDHQYYFTYTYDPDERDYYHAISKYSGSEEVFFTDEYEVNRMDSLVGKTLVVDSEGAIYCIAGDTESIRIYRWILTENNSIGGDK